MENNGAEEKETILENKDSNFLNNKIKENARDFLNVRSSCPELYKEVLVKE